MAGDAFKIGKIMGIDIELHWTFVLLMLVMLYLSIRSGNDVFLLMLLLFICVLIHELTHSFVSLRNRVKVSRIILLPMGGASIINQVGLDPKAEFNIAISGPLMSLFLGCVFGVLVVLAPPGPLNRPLQFLFEINLLLGGFNLLPAFPTDGGRVFRSYLERKYNLYKATMLTIKAGNIVMVLFILGTIVALLLISGSLFFKEIVFMWNLVIVFFLFGGAQTEKELMELRQRSRGISIAEVTSKNFIIVKPTDDAQHLYDAVRKKKMHILLTRLGKEYGYVNLLRREKLMPGMTAQQVAVKIPSIAKNRNVVDALEEMEANEVGIAAVTSGDKLFGIVTMSHMQTFLSLHVLEAKRKDK